MLSDSQLAQVTIAAGISADLAPIPISLALAESGGNEYAHNPIPPDDSYGLWQINMIGRLGPARRAALGLHSNSDLFDPAINAAAMIYVSGGGRSWTPWTTYTSGRYQKFL